MSTLRSRRASVDAGRVSVDERPPVPRRLSVSFPVADPEHQPSGTHDGVGTGGGALLREAYQQFLGTQVFMGAFAPLIYFTLAAFTLRLPTWVRVQHLLSSALLGFIAVSAGAFKLRKLLPPLLRLTNEQWIRAIYALEFASQGLLCVASLNEAVSLGRAAGQPLATSARAFFWGPHITIACKWCISQTPARLMFWPGILLNALYVGIVIVYSAVLPGDSLSGFDVAGMLVGAAVVALLTPLLVCLCQDRQFRHWHSTADEIIPCPSFLVNARDRLCADYTALAERLLNEPVIENAAFIGIEMGALALNVLNGSMHVDTVCTSINIITIATIVLALITKLRAGTTESFRLLEQRLGLGDSGPSKAFAERLAAAVSEHDVLRVASEALHALFPAACAQAVSTLAEGTGTRVALLEVAAVAESDRRALQTALMGAADGSSVAFVCSAAPVRGCIVAHSDDWQPEGVLAFSDWAKATNDGLRADVMVTARLTSGPFTVGFLCLAFHGDGGFPPTDAAAAESLRSFAEAVGDAVLVRRAKDATEHTARALCDVQQLAADIYPQHLLSQLALRQTARAESSQRMERVSLSSSPNDLLTDFHSCVTVIFADVSGFTRIAGCMSPVETMQLLDRLFVRFDTLATSHGVYKVETVGDAYVAVSGMLPARADHARAALRFALDLHAAAAATEVPASAGGGYLSIRVGLHSGPITSGVIGHLRARFCIFGDTVNQASRMESTGRAGCVQLSAAAFEQCQLPAGVAPTRGVDVKGVGHMVTHMVEAGSDVEVAVRDALAIAPPAAPGPSPREAARARWRRLAITMRTAVLMVRIADESAAKRARDAGESGVDSLAPLPPFDVSAVSDRPPSVSGTSSATRTLGSGDGSDGAEGLRTLAMSHLAQQTVSIWAPPLLYHGFAAMQTANWLADDVPGAARVLALYRPFYLVGFATFWLFVFAYALRGRLRPLPWHAALAWAQAALMLHTTVTHTLETVLKPLAGQACSDPSPAACIRQQYWGIHLMFVPTLWLQARLPLRLVVFPELLRSFLYAAMALVAARGTGALTPLYAAGVALETALAAAVVPFLLGLCYDATHATADLLADTDTCPPLLGLRACRDALVAASAATRARLFRDASLIDDQSAIMFTAIGAYIVFQSFVLQKPTNMSAIAAQFNAALAYTLFASAATKMRDTGNAQSLDALAARVHAAEMAAALRDLRGALAVARSEAAMLRAAGDALRQLFPAASGWAIGAFAEGAGCDVIAVLEAGPDEAGRAAMAAALPPGAGADVPDRGVSAVRVACHASAAAVRVVNSREQPTGVAAFADWAAAAAAGLPSAQAVTAPLTAGPRVVGFVTLHFSVYAARTDAGSWGQLTEFADVLGGALFVGRAFALNRDAAVPGAIAAAPRAAAPARSPLASRGSRAQLALRLSLDGDGTWPPPGSPDAAALAALDATAAADAAALKTWALDMWTLEEGEVERLCVAMFHGLGLLRALRVSPVALAELVGAVATHMNDAPFHNMRHVATVTHVAYLFLLNSGLRRKKLLQDGDCLALMLAAICHDLEHTGLTNSYHVSTRSALALRYHDTSVLENHHASVALQLLEKLPAVLGRMATCDAAGVRKTLVQAILATDMSVHGDLLARMNARLANAEGFAPDSVEDRRLLVAFLLHSADLCNPLKPHAVSRRITADLGREFAAQAALESAAGLPVSVMLSPTEVTRATNEVGFISAVVSPLYKTLAELAPPLGVCLTLIEANRRTWEEVIANARRVSADAGRGSN